MPQYGPTPPAQHAGLHQRIGIGVAAVITRARPAELGYHDALAGIGRSQHVVDADRLVDRGGFRDALPVRQHVGGDEVDGRRKLGMIEPGAPDFAGGHWDGRLALDAMDLGNEFVDGLLAAVDRLVADHDAVDVAMLARKIDDVAHFAAVALGVLVDPGTHRHPQPELTRHLRHQLGAAGRRIGAHHPGIRRDGLQVGANLFGA
jgi:hypothetical protein